MRRQFRVCGNELGIKPAICVHAIVLLAAIGED
jgi:hypothetical protein